MAETYDEITELANARDQLMTQSDSFPTSSNHFPEKRDFDHEVGHVFSTNAYSDGCTALVGDDETQYSVDADVVDNPENLLPRVAQRGQVVGDDFLVIAAVHDEFSDVDDQPMQFADDDRDKEHTDAEHIADHKNYDVVDHLPEKITELDFRSVFPVSRIKKIFRAGWGDGGEANPDEHQSESDMFAFDCPNVTAEAIAMLSHAAALMVDDLVKCTAEQTLKRGKKTVAFEDISLVIGTLDRLSFLQDVVPANTTSLQTSVLTASAQRQKTKSGQTILTPNPLPENNVGISSFFKKK